MIKVLVVDDAVFMRSIIKNILVKNGFEVVGEAVNGSEAVQKYNALSPDLVTMDITMPEMDGIQALKEIKKIDPQAKIVMVTAMGQETMVKEAIYCGAVNFIVKPFNEDIVIRALKKSVQ